MPAFGMPVTTPREFVSVRKLVKVFEYGGMETEVDDEASDVVADYAS